VAMAVKAAAGDLPGRDVERGEQAGDAMADVVVGAPLGQSGPQRQHRRGAVQGLDLGLLVHAQHHRAGGRLQVQPADVGHLGQQLRVGGELERLQAVGGKLMVGPHPSDGHAADLEVVGEGAGRPVSDAKALGWAGQGGGHDLGPSILSDGGGRPERGWSTSPSKPWAA
jgi:hypothetical protein